METKKNPSVDLRKKSPLFFQFGLLAALSVVLFSFEIKQHEKPLRIPPSTMLGTVIEETIIQTKQEVPKPPTQTIQAPITTINIVDTDPDIDFPDLIFIDVLPGSNIPVYVPPATRTKHNTTDPVIPIPEVQASFKGGDPSLFAFLNQNLKYPETAKLAGIEGTVYVEFTVEKDGSITDIAIRQGGLGGGCEEAALEVVAKMPEWLPAKQRNRPVRSRFVLPISFQLVN